MSTEVSNPSPEVARCYLVGDTKHEFTQMVVYEEILEVLERGSVRLSTGGFARR